jgi:lambda repressor-like predicted transcriptional regulator
VNRLQKLIQTRMAERGWSYGSVSRRGNLPRSTVHNLATREQLQRPPHRTTLAALARGLDLPPEIVTAAAAAAAGLDVGGTTEVDAEVAALIADLQKLDPTDRQHVAALIASLLRPEAERRGARVSESETGEALAHEGGA